MLETKFLRVREAAAYLNLSKSNLDKMRCYGGGPAYFKLGNTIVYGVEDLDAWVAERRRVSTWGDNDNGRRAA